MKRLIREPVVHFLLIGAALFTVASLQQDSGVARDDRIVVPGGKVEHLAALFRRTWQRPPTADELRGLVRDYIREEAAYREGAALGLDRDDAVIRRRVRQKLEFIAEDLVSQVEPTESVLAAYLADHAEDFRIPPRLSFRQIYFVADGRDEQLDRRLSDLVARLNDDPSIDTAQLGDRILLEHGYADISGKEIAGLFGEEFAAQLLELEPGLWSGPVYSGYGAHAVIVDERTAARLPELAEVRETVRREWENARREQAMERFYTELLEKYDVAVEWPEGLGAPEHDATAREWPR